MKKILSLLFIGMLILTSCSKEHEVKFEAYNPEVFTFDIGNEYEVNATIRVKGFKEIQKGEEFIASVGYEIDLVKPNGETVKSMISKIEDLNFREQVKDAGLDIQFNLDSTYAQGKYKLVFNLKDTNTGNTAVSTAEFELTE